MQYFRHFNPSLYLNLHTSNKIEKQKISSAVNDAMTNIKVDISRNNLNKKEELDKVIGIAGIVERYF